MSSSPLQATLVISAKGLLLSGPSGLVGHLTEHSKVEQLRVRLRKEKGHVSHITKHGMVSITITRTTGDAHLMAGTVTAWCQEYKVTCVSRREEAPQKDTSRGFFKHPTSRIGRSASFL